MNMKVFFPWKLQALGISITFQIPCKALKIRTERNSVLPHFTLEQSHAVWSMHWRQSIDWSVMEKRSLSQNLSNKPCQWAHCLVQLVFFSFYNSKTFLMKESVPWHSGRTSLTLGNNLWTGYFEKVCHRKPCCFDVSWVSEHYLWWQKTLAGVAVLIRGFTLEEWAWWFPGRAVVSSGAASSELGPVCEYVWSISWGLSNVLRSNL